MIFLVKRALNTFRAKCTVSIFDIKGKKWLDSSTMDNPKAYSTEMLPTEQSNYEDLNKLPEDVLVFDFLLQRPDTVTTTSYPSMPLTDTRESLVMDLKYLYETPLFSDVVLRIGEDVLHAHWFVLCGRCSYFRKMRESGMAESERNSIEITDIRLHALKKVVEYIYTGAYKIEEDVFLQYDLYYAADKYGLMNLRTTCSKFLLSKISKDTALSILVRVDQHNDSELKEQILSFIKLHVDYVVQTAAWDSFVTEKEKLAVEVVNLCTQNPTYQNIDNHFKTQVFSRSYRFRWTIENFSLLDNEFVGPDIHVSPAHVWNIKVTKSTWILNLFYLCNKSGDSFKVQSDLSILDLKDKKLFNGVRSFTLNPASSVDIVPDMSSYINEFKMLFEDVLIFDCLLQVTGTHTTGISELLPPEKIQDKLSSDFREMFETSLCADTTLTVGGDKLRVHSSLMCSRSAYFKRMLESGAHQNSLEIDDIKFPVLKKLVEFLYTGTYEPKDDFDMVSDLYCAAAKWEVLDFHRMCENLLLNSVNCDNAIQVLLLADRHGDTDFKKIISFFIRFHIYSFMNTEGWKTFAFEYSKLWAEIIK